MSAGEYVLKVEGADARANTPSSPYVVSFIVQEVNGLTLVSPYPNPADANVSYGFISRGDDVPLEMSFNITDLRGQSIATQRTDGSDFHTGTNIVLWSVQNSGGDPLPAGLYIYVVSLKFSEKSVVIKGKLVVSH